MSERRYSDFATQTPVCETCADKVREWLYGRRCLFCKYARVEIVQGDKDPYAADTYCGNEDSPAYDRTVSFFGADTCGHFEKGEPVHETPDERSGVAAHPPEGGEG